jgi:mRNA-degrading endonuclease toxin of MazEF toxin-antitoxin module
VGTFTKGDVIIASLSYSDFSGGKRRPALVVAAPPGLDPVLCLITSRVRKDGFDVRIAKADFANGGLSIDSYVRTCHLFTLDPSMIDYTAGRLKPEKIKEVTAKIVEMLKS